MGGVKTALCMPLAFAGAVALAGDLAANFRSPPDSARPQVWWH